jgi:hypothetical protein
VLKEKQLITNQNFTAMTKQDIKKQIENLANELNVTFIEAASAMQAAAAKMGNEKIITIIHKLKMESIGM